MILKQEANSSDRDRVVQTCQWFCIRSQLCSPCSKPLAGVERQFPVRFYCKTEETCVCSLPDFYRNFSSRYVVNINSGRIVQEKLAIWWRSRHHFLFPGGRVDEGFSSFLHGETVLAPNVLVMVIGPDLDGWFSNLYRRGQEENSSLIGFTPVQERILAERIWTHLCEIVKDPLVNPRIILGARKISLGTTTGIQDIVCFRFRLTSQAVCGRLRGRSIRHLWKSRKKNFGDCGWSDEDRVTSRHFLGPLGESPWFLFWPRATCGDWAGSVPWLRALYSLRIAS